MSRQKGLWKFTTRVTFPPLTGTKQISANLFFGGLCTSFLAASFSFLQSQETDSDKLAAPLLPSSSIAASEIRGRRVPSTEAEVATVSRSLIAVTTRRLELSRTMTTQRDHKLQNSDTSRG